MNFLYGKKFFEKIQPVAVVFATIISVYCVIRYSKECSRGIMDGLSFCVGVLVPSLFLFIVMASFVANSVAGEILSRLMGLPVKAIFRLPPSCSGAIVMSLIGGYPVGARYVSALYENRQISKRTAKKLSMFTVCSGPGFVLNYIGNALLNNKYMGMILLVSQAVSFLLTGVIVCKVYKSDRDLSEYDTVDKTRNKNHNLLVKAVSDGCSATVSMCSMVIVFSAIISVCDKVFEKSNFLCDFIPAVLEVTMACNRLCNRYPLTVISFIVGFGGICVHFQVFSALKSININKVVFFLFRIIQGIISSAVTYILLILFDDTVVVFSTANEVSTGVPSSVWGSTALLLTAVCFIGSLNYSQLKEKH